MAGLFGLARSIQNAITATISGDVEVVQPTHDDLNCNANIQVGDADVSPTNPVPIASDGITITVEPTVTAGAYIAGDCVGGELTFANAGRINGGGGVIKNMVILDDAGQDVELELWLFDTTITSPGDNAPWVCPEDELETLVAIITTADGAYFAAGTPSAARVEASQRYDCAAGDTDLYGQLVTRGAPTYAATDDVTVRIMLLQD